MPTKPSTDWTGAPTTYGAAAVKEHKSVSNASVVKLSKAFIRGSEITNGVFLLADGAEVRSYAGRQRIEVQCLWFGRKPKTTWMNITLLCAPKFDSSYTGDVAWDIRK
jgi:hypothetical protein